jgi:hypothetical protein
MEVGEGNDSTIKNHLDHKYLTEFERVEIRKYKDIYYIGHKAHLRKVAVPPRSTRRASATRRRTTSRSSATTSPTASK